MSTWKEVTLMRRLTKIKLVNWHLFVNQTIEIKDNTLISGENGSGKSTLLDALQYLLIGAKSGVKFNIAATDEARRSLEGYIRGRIGAENKEFLRNGDVVTHVALEFYDQQTDTTGVLGCVLELPKTGTLKERFYLFEKLEMHENMFLDGKFPRDYKSMKAYMKTLELELEPFDSQKKYRDALARFFGLDAKKYAKILPKALAFRPIDLQAFVFEFLLDDDPIDIQSLKNNVEQLKRVEGQIRLDREKLDKLNKIIDLGQNLTSNQDQIDINNLIEQLSFVEQKETFLQQSESLLDTVNQRYERLKADKENLDQLIEENDQAISQLESARLNNDLGRTLSSYQEALEKKTESYTQQREVVTNLRENLNRETELLRQFVEIQPNVAVSSFIKYYQTKDDNIHTGELIHQLEGVARETASYHSVLQVEKANQEKQRAELAEELRGVQLRLNQLKRNVKTYPRHVTALIEVLNAELSELYQKDIRIRPFCDLIEVNDEKWRNALEGFLNTQRFDLIVEPAYFNDALEIYERVKFEQKIYGVGLVNTQRILEYTEFQPHSLTSKITSSHTYAQHYANMLMGNVICVDHVSELKNFNRSISQSCMTYNNYTARQMNPRVYEIPYIGQAATDMQVKLEEDTLDGLEGQVNKLYDTIEQLQALLRILNQSKAQMMIAQNQIRYFDIVKQTRKELVELEEKVAELSADASFARMEEQLTGERQKKRQLRLDLEAIVSKMANARTEKTNILEQIDDAKDKLAQLITEQRKLSSEHPTKLNAAFAQFNALKQRFSSDYAKISKDLAQSNIAIRTQTAKAENEVVNLMRNYINAYHFGAAPDLSELIEFEKEAMLIRDNNLVKYEQDAIDLRRSSEISFKEEFVNKLRASIENAQQQIAELNIALTGKTFGSDSYQLITKPSEDPLFSQYYKMIMSNDVLESHSLFSDSLSKKNEIILMELFNKIASSDPENDKIAYQYLDYRYYMSYDIEVINANGNRLYFSKVAREKSGGETQVPFYIVIAASFQQLLTRNKRLDSGCIVLFDEAFNNMDSSRIDAMMKFYNSLSIQLFIAVPPQRVSNIISYVNTSLAIVKDNDYAIVETFKQDKRN